MSDLTREALEAQLRSTALGRSLTLVARTASTNDDARRAASAGAPHGHTVVADAQSAGRGSRGRTWLSPAGKDLYVSVVARLALPIASVPPLTLAVGLATAEALAPFLPREAQPLVKWPNDVWVARRKIAGILVESSSIGERTEALVLGIGINVNRDAFPEALAHPATSLALARGAPARRAEVLARLLERLEEWLARFEREGPAQVVEALSERLALKGERASCEGRLGTVVGVAPDGALLLSDADGVHALYAGTLRPCETAVPTPA